VALATWDFGLKAVKVAAPMLARGASSLDAGERGVNAVELDPSVMSVGLGGRPNAKGFLEMDAAVMAGNPVGYGAVAGMRGIATPCSVARKVMELTPHCMLVGEGARQFALTHGFRARDLMTPKARKLWLEWRARNRRRPEGHDTIGFLALDRGGSISAVLSTSGLAWKMPGRVGDSPLAGAGLLVDPEVGAACATGVGEEIMRVAGSAVVIEAMRRGASPQEAVMEALARTYKASRAVRNDPSVEVAFLALDLKGRIGAGSLCPFRRFRYALWRSGGGTPRLVSAPVLAR
jgi:N4-(beta-N-acetylglucosaminyl)-L-asparaginase